MKNKRDITILAVGDWKDYDTYKKFHREQRLINSCGFEYLSLDYRHLLEGRIPKIETEKIVLFLFFPFYYWDRYIEHKDYRGIYGNRSFFKKFLRFWDTIEGAVRKNFSDKAIFFVNPPRLCGRYRDKLFVMRELAQNNIPTPGLHRIYSIREVRHLLNQGESFFLKPRYGSMGKGITFLSWSNWQTNFIFKENRIISKRSDRGWKFRDITGNAHFLRKLLKHDILFEKAIDSLVLKEKKIDLRVYTFFNKTIYVYPRRNSADKITTNISQGGRGDPHLLEIIPPRQLARAKRTAEKASRLLGLNLAGIDVMLDRNLRDVYIVDINVFPGFPKRRTFRLARALIKELARADRYGKIHFQRPVA